MSRKAIIAAAGAALVLPVLAPTISSASIPGFPGRWYNCIGDARDPCYHWVLDYHLKPRPGIPFNSPTRQLRPPIARR